MRYRQLHIFRISSLIGVVVGAYFASACSCDPEERTAGLLPVDSLGAASDSVESNRPPDSVSRALYPSGELQSETPFLDGSTHGLKKSYYPSGKIQSEMSFRHGAQNGVTRVFAENGQKTVEVQFVAGFENGQWKEWYPDGTPRQMGEVIDGNLHGHWIEYWENGKKKAEGEYHIFTLSPPSDATVKVRKKPRAPASGEDHSHHAHPVGLRHGPWRQWDSTGHATPPLEYVKGVVRQ